MTERPYRYFERDFQAKVDAPNATAQDCIKRAYDHLSNLIYDDDDADFSEATGDRIALAMTAITAGLKKLEAA